MKISFAHLVNENSAGHIYRKFFKSAIVVALSSGCLFGAILLFYYGFNKSFFSVPLNLIHLHGHFQVFGWVGLFVMGYAYQTCHNTKSTILHYSSLVDLSFYLMIAGLMLRALTQGLIRGQFLIIGGILAGCLEVSAVSLFLFIMIKVSYQGHLSFKSHDKFTFTALAGFWLVAFLDPVLFYFANNTSDEKSLINFIATWFFPYRELQLVAFAAMFIFGVSLRFIPSYFGFQALSKARSSAAYLLLCFSLVIEFIFYLLLRHNFSPVWGVGLQISFLSIFASVVMITTGSGILSRPEKSNLILRFVRTSYFWLIASLVLLVLFPIYNRLTSQPFSHAFFGAYRHSLSVGFISMMILGISIKVVPIWSGSGIRSWNLLNSSFYLLNIGNIIRVTFQVATEYFEWAYAIMGISGFIEVIAIAFWGVVIWRVMGPLPSKKEAKETRIYPQTTAFKK